MSLIWVPIIYPLGGPMEKMPAGWRHNERIAQFIHSIQNINRVSQFIHLFEV